jgi:hypothetical protein
VEGLAADLPAKPPKRYITQTGTASEDVEGDEEKDEFSTLALHIFPLLGG